MRSPYFLPAHESFREQVRNVLRRHVLPFADAWERERRIPKDLWKTLGEAGLLGLNYPKSCGGSEQDFFFSTVLLEEVGRLGYGGFRAALSVHAYMATDYLLRAGSDDQRHRYLGPAARGDKLAALAITEANAGSDLSQVDTTACREGDHYVVTGSKAFVTSAFTADFLILAVRTAPRVAARRGATGLSLLIVDATSDGISRRELEKIGWRCSDTADVAFENVRVPVQNLLGYENHGFQHIMQCFQLERIVAAVLALGAADACLNVTRDYMNKRKAFGQPLSAFQALRHRMANLVTELEAARQLVYHTVWLYQQGELPVTECSMSKLLATEVAHKVADECLQFHGGYGYLESSPIARLYRDIRVGTIVGGASEVMREIIANEALDGLHYGSIAAAPPSDLESA
jgi:acyl-CoA dehydrogenase